MNKNISIHYYIYLITESPVKNEEFGGYKYFKIGYTTDLKRRRSALQCGTPFRLMCVRTYLIQDKEDLVKEKEKEFLGKFRNFKNECRGEWFWGDIKKAVSLFDSILSSQDDPQFKLNKELNDWYDRDIEKVINENKRNEKDKSKERKNARKKQLKKLY